MLNHVEVRSQGCGVREVNGGGTAASLRWYHHFVVTAYSKLTAEGETSVPDEIRRKLGLGPGSVLKWEEEGDRIVVRRADAVPAGEPERGVSVGQEARERPSGNSVRRLFGIARRPDIPPLSVEEMDEAIGRYLAADDERIRKGEE